MYLARQTGPDHPVAAPLAGPQVLLLGEGRSPAYLKAVLEILGLNGSEIARLDHAASWNRAAVDRVTGGVDDDSDPVARDLSVAFAPT